MNTLYDEFESELSEEIESDIEYDLNDDYIDIYNQYEIDDVFSSESISILNSINSSSYDILTYLDIMYYQDDEINNDIISIKNELVEINTILSDFVQYYYNNDTEGADGGLDPVLDELPETDFFVSGNDLIVQDALSDVSNLQLESEYDYESYITIKYYENEIQPFLFNCIGLLAFALFVVAGCIIGVSWNGSGK